MGFFRDFLESRAQRTSPAYAAQKRIEEKRAYDRSQAEAIARANVYGEQGQAAVPEQTAQYQQSDAEMFPGEAPIAGLKDITQQAQQATPGTGFYDKNVDAQTRAIGLQDRMLKSGIPTLQEQALSLQTGFQNSLMNPKQARALNNFEQSQATPEAWAAYNKQMQSLKPTTDKRTANRKDFDYWSKMPEGPGKVAYGKMIFGDAKPTASQKIFEKAEAERIVKMPQTIDSMDSMLTGLDEQDQRLQTIKENINDSLSFNTTTGFLGAKASEYAGTDAFEQKQRIDQFGSKVYFNAIADLKSQGVSLGPQTDRDMEALRNAEANLKVAQSGKEQRKQIAIIQKKQNALRMRIQKRRDIVAKNWNKNRKNLPSTATGVIKPLNTSNQTWNTQSDKAAARRAELQAKAGK